MYYGTETQLTDPHSIRLIGAPFDGTVSFRPGTRFGPAGIRAAADGLESYSPLIDADLESVSYADAGDLFLPMGNTEIALSMIREAIEECLDDGALPFLLGGEHLVSLPAIQAVHARYPGLVVVQLDAHADQREDYLGIKLSHASVIRRVSEFTGQDHIRQIGIRSGTQEEYRLMREHGTLTTFREEDLAALKDWIGERPLYLTVDLDVFDPAYLPGTGTPEPGGIDWWTFQRFLKWMQGCHIVGMDAVELAPQLDASGCSSVLAAKVVREMLLVAGAGRD
ncbi:MAG: agmatinase [Zetaproteobacteria bacterium CG12_big_fil_rev_8_21_14_0_65_55_1124]|nr:MAG: agmatinase [Zetaproteobacteria bacterium CG1_02_55_237]PIS20487.1 MAG: agmatinase [Zetaproteobacteria bacterium CG08_land_8_20_14_0_20_55_17]PIW43766.1 MAG: agmatinase [Zetaproteobacteria bacterium CG12_big_fil_rev_8_21_14_0_65_55_1124]PIY53301.1 MAG: agmatinase [Zetaproteobacteria bacterium CG_4_10_14_0_8_um_filter_55_43]PIZ40126.1 MAG: agmatinase [Zetaproteobacteria bacterium CG_4_10_14_0_2_um_filter_55_20]PJB82131.1 MAG: agmatinase [Zetaproteobacteria bacterium CG_4_9_14_0_8_um_filt